MLFRVADESAPIPTAPATSDEMAASATNDTAGDKGERIQEQSSGEALL
jgi:hypothetical protein